MTFRRGSVTDRTFLHPSSPTFGSGSTGLVERSFVAAGRRFRQTLLRLLDDLATGAIDLQGFSRRANRLLLQTYTTVFSLGAISVDPFHILTHADTEILQREIATEQRFLRAFSRELGRGHYYLNPSIRAQLYLLSLRGIFELGRLQAMPSGEIEWVLGDKHHCIECIQAASGGPYQRSRWEHLGLPVLPGIPGAGEICLGLTRCGCTLRLRGQFRLPGEDIQDHMRDLLAEITHADSASY